ncbi:glycosyl hydrolase-related protein [Flagellimonas aequoris]|uniref:Alpha-mannosidase n=1 Tax=Flagellimonas aequoris TaxID=2306997 RepID=A0A418N844_9FLAO|nr:glycosyl hydrolase-related protein [Allomuricauda aequoris]RIV71537.1 alpha-mannosidase [Allomuricauda aequoris]TXK03102.1 alpha-mannosidase [Allomuricauda aequoris]
MIAQSIMASKIKRNLHILFVMWCCHGFGQTDTNLTMVAIEYVKPYEYHQQGKNLVTKAFLDLERPRDFKGIVLENGYTSNLEFENGKAWVWLPVFGKPQTMKIVASKKHAVKEQLFKPLVTSDWGYFKEGTFHIISSSHQDIAWMDTPDYCRHERVNDIIAPALDIMKKDKEYRFGMEQALNLKEFIEEFPERKEEVIQRQKEGRFTWGATYNQPYEGMQTGEQLVREMYFGKRWIKDNFDGIVEETAFNTDVPGRTLQFPQILAKADVENLFVSRMREGFYEWYSPDGSSVLTYTPGNYGWAVIFYKLFEEDAIEAMHKIQNRVEMWSDYYKEHNLPPHFAIVISNDASGPANYGNLIKEWNNIVSTTGMAMPKIRHSTVSGFLSEIKRPGAKFEQLEGSRPDLWAYIHGPGHYEAVTASRKAGRLLPSAEIFGTVDALLKDSFEDYPQKELSKAFEESIYPDHGWGGKNGDITDSIFRSKLEFAANEADRILDSSLKSISNKVATKAKNAILVFNDLSWDRDGLVTVELEDNGPFYVIDEKGMVVPSQMSDANGKLLYFHASKIPAIGYKTYYLKKGRKAVATNKTVLPNSLTNQFYSIQLGDGGIAYLYDKVLDKEVLNTTRFSGGDVLTLGYNGNGAGEFTQITEPNMQDYDKMSDHVANWALTSDGDVFAEFKNETKFKHTGIVQRIRVYHHEKKIDFFIDLLDWDGTHNREFRFALPLQMVGSRIKYEVPMAIAEVGKSEMKEAPGGWAWGGSYDQKPVTIRPREVMNYISSQNDDLAVTLGTDVALADWVDPTREAVDYTVLQGILLASHKSCHAEGNWYHQTGDHHFKFSVASHVPGDRISYEFGVGSNHPFRAVLKKHSDGSGTLPQEMGFFKVSEPMVRISTIKKSESGEDVIVRLVEMEGKDRHATISLPTQFQELIRTNLIEEDKESLGKISKNLNVDIGHNSIDTYKLILKK